MKVILNKTKLTSERLTLINEGMGGAGDPKHYPTHCYSVADGADRGNGYQGYMSITYALQKDCWMPDEARTNLINWLRSNGYQQYLSDIGL